MWVIWGPASDVKEVGIVAERCPHCRRVAPCRVAARSEGVHLYFITVASGVVDANCTCTSCGGQFRGELWQYKEIVPEIEAAALPLESLLERTNPTLKERLEWEKGLADHGTDPQFTASVESVGQLRPGGLRKGLTNELLRWGQMEEGQRAAVARDADASARSLQFARSVTNRLPGSAGCLVAAALCLAVWSAFLWAPGVRNVRAGAAIVLAGAVAGAMLWQAILGIRMRRWTREVLVPESQKAGIDLRRFLIVLKDVPPPGPHGDELRDLKAQEGTIREELRKLGMAD